MGDALAAHLAGLPEPQLKRIAASVIGGSLHDRALTERAIAQRLLDADWLDHTLRELGRGARAALVALFQAGVPVLRRDVTALVHHPDSDPLEELEDHGLVAPVRTGRGMPTHIAIAPGLEDAVRARLDGGRLGAVSEGLWHAGARRRFELAVMVATVGQHPPRMTRDGRLHARDLNALTERLDPLGHRVAAMESRLARWHDAGAVTPNQGRLCVVPDVATNIPELHQRLALNELAAPSLPDGALAAVRILLSAPGATPLRTVLESAQASLLRDRAEADEPSIRRGARSELLEVMSALLLLESVVLLDAAGHPLLGSSDDLLQRVTSGEDLGVALDPVVAAALRGSSLPAMETSTGHVQSSFEIIADVSCDPSLIARIGLCARIVRADRAAVLRLEQPAIEKGRALGVGRDSLLASLEALSGRPVPTNVATVLRDWYGPELPAGPDTPGQIDLRVLREMALAALATGERDR